MDPSTISQSISNALSLIGTLVTVIVVLAIIPVGLFVGIRRTR